VWYDSPAKTDNVLHGLQTGMGPGVIVLQDKGRLLLWLDSGNSSLQPSQRRDVAFRFDVLSGFKKIQKDHPFPIPKAVHITLPGEGCILNFFFDGNSHVATPWTAVLTPACIGDTTSRHR
jgi:hypothetical protein